MPWVEYPYEPEPPKKKIKGSIKAILMVILAGTVISLVLYVVNGYPNICT